MSLRVLLATEASEGLGHVAPWRGLLETLIASSTKGPCHLQGVACHETVLVAPLAR